MTDRKTPHPLVAIIPVVVLIGLLVIVISLFGSDALSGGSQMALLMGVAVCAVKYRNKVGLDVLHKIQVSFLKLFPSSRIP